MIRWVAVVNENNVLFALCSAGSLTQHFALAEYYL